MAKNKLSASKGPKSDHAGARVKKDPTSKDGAKKKRSKSKPAEISQPAQIPTKPVLRNIFAFLTRSGFPLSAAQFVQEVDQRALNEWCDGPVLLEEDSESISFVDHLNDGYVLVPRTGQSPSADKTPLGTEQSTAEMGKKISAPAGQKPEISATSSKKDNPCLVDAVATKESEPTGAVSGSNGMSSKTISAAITISSSSSSDSSEQDSDAAFVSVLQKKGGKGKGNGERKLVAPKPATMEASHHQARPEPQGRSVNQSASLPSNAPAKKSVATLSKKDKKKLAKALHAESDLALSHPEQQVSSVNDSAPSSFNAPAKKSARKLSKKNLKNLAEASHAESESDLSSSSSSSSISESRNDRNSAGNRKWLVTISGPKTTLRRFKMDGDDLVMAGVDAALDMDGDGSSISSSSEEESSISSSLEEELLKDELKALKADLKATTKSAKDDDGSSISSSLEEEVLKEQLKTWKAGLKATTKSAKDGDGSSISSSVEEELLKEAFKAHLKATTKSAKDGDGSSISSSVEEELLKEAFKAHLKATTKSAKYGDGSSISSSPEEELLKEALKAHLKATTKSAKDGDGSSISSSSEEEILNEELKAMKAHLKATTKSAKRKRSSSPAAPDSVKRQTKKSRQSVSRPVSGPAPTPASNGKPLNKPFSRVTSDIKVDPKFASNAYIPYDYAQRAHQDLSVTKGKGFTKEKNKKKRGSYRGGYIDVEGKKGIRFD